MDMALVILSYLLGSIPFGLLIARCKGVKDIRSEGSGNIGATNVTRVIGKKIGALVLLLDGLKGATAILMAQHFAQEAITIFMCAALVILGHIFPIWLKFKGGKGVATTIAVLLMLSPLVGLLLVATWVVVYTLTKISSLSALVSVLLLPLYAFIFYEGGSLGFVYLCGFLTLTIFLTHHQNIKRLLKGEEKTVK